MAAKKRVPPRPTPPAPKPPLKPSQRKGSKAGPKPSSGGFGRPEDQIIRAGSSVVNTAGSAVRGVAGAVGKAANTAGKIATGNIGKGFASGTLMGPATKKRPERGPGGSRPQGGRIAKVEPKRDPKESMQPRSGKRKPPTKPRPERGPGRSGRSKPELPKTY